MGTQKLTWLSDCTVPAGPDEGLSKAEFRQWLDAFEQTHGLGDVDGDYAGSADTTDGVPVSVACVEEGPRLTVTALVSETGDCLDEVVDEDDDGWEL